MAFFLIHSTLISSTVRVVASSNCNGRLSITGGTSLRLRPFASMPRSFLELAPIGE
jgi:hypothetical protein